MISIPVSIVARIGRAERDGVLIKRGEYLETSAKVDTLVVDKTGRLTNGTPRFVAVDALNADFAEEQILRLAATAETASEHPPASAITEGARERGVDFTSAVSATLVVGKGISAEIDGHTIAVGSPDSIGISGSQFTEQILAG